MLKELKESALAETLNNQVMRTDTNNSFNRTRVINAGKEETGRSKSVEGNS